MTRHLLAMIALAATVSCTGDAGSVDAAPADAERADVAPLCADGPGVEFHLNRACVASPLGGSGSAHWYLPGCVERAVFDLTTDPIHLAWPPEALDGTELTLTLRGNAYLNCDDTAATTLVVDHAACRPLAISFACACGPRGDAGPADCP